MNATIGRQTKSSAEALRDRFVGEVGVRQAWPFVTFCDPASTPAGELRLYIDTALRVEPGQVVDDGDPDSAVVQLLALNNRTVTDVETKAGELRLAFDGGDVKLVVRGTAASFTTGDVWWLGAR